MVIDEAPDVLEDDDVLEMVNAGLAPITVVDDYLAEFWSKVFTDIKVHRDVAVRSGGNLAVAFRKENPQLREAVNTWIRKHGKGDAFRNVVERRYLQNVKYAKNAAADAERQKLQAVVELFKKYGAQYNLDYLLMAAQGYQESTLDQNVKSPVGAIGVMQVMPPTGKELKVGDITQIEPNIHAGVKYMRFMMDQYFKDEPMDNLNKALMTFAAYNAGPGRLRQLRRETEKRGLDPNVWFGNVERIASERIGRETVTYVSNIYKYYIAYRLMHRSAGATRSGEGGGREGQVNTPPEPLAEEPADFSLVLGGPLYQLLRRSHLSDDALTLVHRRILAGVLITWLPLLLLSMWEGRAWWGDVTVPFLLNAEVQARFLARAAAPHHGGARRPRSHEAARGAVPRARPDCRPGPAPLQRGHRIGVASAEFVGRRAPAHCPHLRARHPDAELPRRRREHLGRGIGGEAAPDSPICRSPAGGTRWSACRCSSSCSCAGISACSSGPAFSGRCHASTSSSSRRIPTASAGWDSSPMSSTRSLRCSSRTGCCSRA